MTNWFSCNDMVCSSDKTKLLVIGTSANRQIKLKDPDINLHVNICGVNKNESTSEKLLGVIVNNTPLWRLGQFTMVSQPIRLILVDFFQRLFSILFFLVVFIFLFFFVVFDFLIFFLRSSSKFFRWSF